MQFCKAMFLIEKMPGILPCIGYSLVDLIIGPVVLIVFDPN